MSDKSYLSQEFINLRYVLEKDKLTASNFKDWSANLRIVPSFKNIDYVLDQPIPEEPNVHQHELLLKWKEHSADFMMVTNIMLGSVSHEYVKLIASKNAYEAFSELENMFLRRARVATMRMLITCKMQEGSSASTHLKRMKGYLNHLESLGSPVHEGIAVDMVLGSLAGSLDDWALRLVKSGWDGSL